MNKNYMMNANDAANELGVSMGHAYWRRNLSRR